MSGGNSKRVEGVEAAILAGDSFVELDEQDFRDLRAALNQLFIEKYRRKSRSSDKLVVEHCQRVMREVSRLEDQLRVLHRQLREHD